MGCQRINSNLSFTSRSHQHHTSAPAGRGGLTAPTRREHRAIRATRAFGEQTPSTTAPGWGDNPSMTLADAQQQRLLELLREAAEEPTRFAELHAGGISFPAAVISEPELNGYPIERVYDHTPPLAKNAPELPGPGMPRRGVAPAFSVCVDRASTSHSRLARQRRGGPATQRCPLRDRFHKLVPADLAETRHPVAGSVRSLDPLAREARAVVGPHRTLSVCVRW